MTTQEELSRLSGQKATPEQLSRLRSLLPSIPDRVLRLFADYPIVGVSFSLAEEDDDSELGAEVRILSAEEIADEATNAYPGIAALPLGFLPVGSCLEGSGDPYFVSCQTEELVRIPHNAVRQDDSVDLGQVETVSRSLDEFLRAATPYPGS